ncbi:hypothetical protein GCM10010249_11550 [Streptomyces roseolilacinus]|uniref:Uncharacterized protein n=1 Tax=Streptomyces roseolilacinus TaxID=66904 RepID=A0A918AZA0_9ACTN|nr:hypothetical protein GCM10010249_11550 [Streptomyces roseolilacinus]
MPSAPSVRTAPAPHQGDRGRVPAPTVSARDGDGWVTHRRPCGPPHRGARRRARSRFRRTEAGTGVFGAGLAVGPRGSGGTGGRRDPLDRGPSSVIGNPVPGSPLAQPETGFPVTRGTHGAPRIRSVRPYGRVTNGARNARAPGASRR